MQFSYFLQWWITITKTTFVVPHVWLTFTAPSTCCYKINVNLSKTNQIAQARARAMFWGSSRTILTLRLVICSLQSADVFPEGEKRRPKIRLPFAGYVNWTSFVWKWTGISPHFTTTPPPLTKPRWIRPCFGFPFSLITNMSKFQFDVEIVSN